MAKKEFDLKDSDQEVLTTKLKAAKSELQKLAGSLGGNKNAAIITCFHQVSAVNNLVDECLAVLQTSSFDPSLLDRAHLPPVKVVESGKKN